MVLKTITKPVSIMACQTCQNIKTWHQSNYIILSPGKLTRYSIWKPSLVFTNNIWSQADLPYYYDAGSYNTDVTGTTQKLIGINIVPESYLVRRPRIINFLNLRNNFEQISLKAAWSVFYRTPSKTIIAQWTTIANVVRDSNTRSIYRLLTIISDARCISNSNLISYSQPKNSILVERGFWRNFLNDMNNLLSFNFTV